MAEEMVAPKRVGFLNVLYVMATRAEYGVELQKRIDPLICQVGPVEAAVHMAAHLTNAGQIDLVVSLGSAGAKSLKQAHIYQVSHVSYRDMDASPFGFEKGVTPFAEVPAEIKLPFMIHGLDTARLSTGAAVISGDAYRSVNADMVDMETWAILRACMKARVPLIGLRGISDGAEPVAGYSDWTRYLQVIDERLADAVDVLEHLIETDALIAV